MANECIYTLKAAGTEEHVRELLDIMQYKKEDTAMFARIFSAEEEGINSLTDGRTLLTIGGDCAWSVYSCMFGGVLTYYESAKTSYPQLSTIPAESARLGLDIEIYSTEPGIGFAEHYRVINGEIILSQETPYYEAYWDKDEYPTFREFKEAHALSDNISEDDFDEDGWASIGGYDVQFELDKLIS